MREFQGKAVENGNVVQWCSVRTFHARSPILEFHIAVPEFLDGDDALLRIGVANDRALTVMVFLAEPVEVLCSQEGLETWTSLGLRYLLPERVREYISCALEGDDDLSSMNVVEGLLGNLIRAMRQRSISGKSGTSDPSLTFKSESEIQKQVRGGNVNYEFWTERNIFIGCLGFRIINALLVQTYFNPDEHWQALEVAHRIVFGYGHLTWEWEKGIRSYLHPLIFALLYKILAIFQLDTVWFMIKAPRLLQSLFAAIGDIYLYKLAGRCFGKHVSQWAVSSFYE